jgi:hypothetical protein
MDFSLPPISPLAIHFFGLFSRTEFALKRCKGFRTQRRGFVEANWPEFAKTNNIQGLYDPLSQDARAKELIDSPPKNRIVVGDALPWSDRPKKYGDMREVTQAPKDLRNNLFHGEKGHEENDRDRRLFHAAIYILNEMLNASPEVASKYYF